MGLDRTRWPELMLGLDDVLILEVARDQADRLRLVIETTDDFAGCDTCGSRARIENRPLVGFADLPAFGSPVTLVWRQRMASRLRWICPSVKHWPRSKVSRRLGVFGRAGGFA